MRSIRKNILLALFVAHGLLTLACAVSLVLYVHKQRVAALDAEIARRIGFLVSLIQVNDSNPREVVVSLQAETLPAGDLFVILDSRGVVLGSSRRSKQFLQQVADDRGRLDFVARGEHFRGKALHGIRIIDPDEEQAETPVPEVDVWYAVSVTAFDVDSRHIALLAALAGLFWIGSSGLIAWFSVTRGMRPLGELARQASAITERHWDLALPAEVRDVVETRPLALALEGLIARLSVAFERERAFVSDAAHELKTVVAIQKSSLQVALQGRPSAADFKSGLERALDDVDRLNSLVHRMLSLASIEGDRGREQVVVSLEETILAACEQLSPLAAQRRVTLSTHVSECCRVLGQDALLQTLWVSVLENAIRYSDCDSVVSIGSMIQDRSAIVTVQDRGAGIDARSLPHIFERFYRADASRARATGGFGLGLAIAKAIVEKHQGRIQVYSVLGSGTSVRVVLPRVLPKGDVL